jgi:2-polyprenyl-3-methyl-5-hydroxy-6-metoxy-1,4-benzoquinol methylase
MRKYLLLPQVIRLSLGAPRDPRQAWERYWSEIGSTGPHGQVLWDADVRGELDATVARLRVHGDMGLPLVDLGSGNGRQARALAAYTPRVVGLDAAESAVRRATDESEGVPNVEFRVADVTQRTLGECLAAELGDANVHLRGVLHEVDDAHRPAVVANIHALVGKRGVVHLCETDVRGDALEYLQSVGVTPTSMPDVVRRLVSSGVRPPSHFGDAELATFFPAETWRILASGPTTMYGVPLTPGGPLQHLPSFYAVLRRR